MRKLTEAEFNEFVNRLATFDWYYMYSDDHNYFKTCEKEYMSIQNKALTHTLLKDAYYVYAQFLGNKKSIDGLIQLLRELL